MLTAPQRVDSWHVNVAAHLQGCRAFTLSGSAAFTTGEANVRLKNVIVPLSVVLVLGLMNGRAEAWHGVQRRWQPGRNRVG